MATIKQNRAAAVFLIVALLFGITGSALLIGDLLDYRQGLESRKWLPVEGKIKTQFIRLVNRDGGKNNFALNATYIYHIGERAYAGDTVGFPNVLNFTESEPEKFAQDNQAKSMFAKYAPDAPITVFYNPAANEQSTLTRGASARRFLPSWLRDGLLIALAASIAAWTLKSKANLFKVHGAEEVAAPSSTL